MALGTNVLRRALISRLKAALTDYTTKIFSHVPDSTTFPYIRVGSLTGSPWDSKTFDGQRYLVDIHVFNKNVDSSNSVDAIKELVHTALNRQEAAMNILLAAQTSPSTSVRVALLRYASDVTVPQANEIANGGDHYQHGILTYEILAGDAA